VSTLERSQTTDIAVNTDTRRLRRTWVECRIQRRFIIFLFFLLNTFICRLTGLGMLWLGYVVAWVCYGLGMKWFGYRMLWLGHVVAWVCYGLGMQWLGYEVVWVCYGLGMQWPSPFHPQNRGRGRWLNFWMRFFVPGVRMNGACFAPNWMFSHRTVWPQITIVTHLLTHSLHVDSNSKSFLRNDLLKTGDLPNIC
jgi:hypothetical protein